MYSKSEVGKESRSTTKNKKDMIFYVKWDDTSTLSTESTIEP